MEQYILKSTIVAEIERLINTSLEYGYNTMQKVLADTGKDLALSQLFHSINTLEVKEVDLEKEIKDILNQYYYFPEEVIDTPTIIRITAGHFFELGLKAQKGK